MKSVAVLIAVLMARCVAPAATKIWDGDGSDPAWTNRFNWVGDTAPAAGDDLVFPVSAAHSISTNNFPPATVFGSLQFDGTDYALYGNSISLTGGVSSQASSIGTNLILLPLQFDAPSSLDVVNSNSSLAIAGNVNLNGNLLTIFGPGTVDLKGVISGAAGITKEGSGLLQLGGSAPNTYSGPTVVNDGTLMVNHASALGGTAAGTIVNGKATIRLSPGIKVGAEPLVLNSTGAASMPLAALSADGGSNSWAGAVTLSNNTILAVQLAQYLNFSGPISGPGSLAKTGTNTLIFSGGAGTANSYAGGTYVAQGTLVLAKTIQNSAVPGALFIGDGAAGVAADEVRLVGVPQLNNASAVTIASSGVLDLNNISEDVGSIAGSETATIRLGSGTLTLGLDNSSTTFSGHVTGTGGMIKSGSGVFSMSGETSYTGATIVNAGTLVAGGTNLSSSCTVNSAGTLAGNGSVGPITVSGGNLNPGDINGAMTCRGLGLNSASDFIVQFDSSTFDAPQSPLRVQGTVNLGGAALRFSIPPGTAPIDAKPVVLIENDGVDAVSGTFAGLPNGSILSLSNLQFRVNYNGGSGNDVTLTLTNLAMKLRSTQIAGGNSNGMLDPNECDSVSVLLTNVSSLAVNITNATLKPNSPGISVVQPFSAFPSIAANQTATNAIPFQVVTAPNLPCGTVVQLSLVLSTVSHGTFSIPIDLPIAANCSPGAGPCDLCASTTVFGSVTPGSATQNGRLFRNGSASVCGTQKFCPGVILETDSFHYDAVKFKNGEAEACITVSISAPCAPRNAVFCTAYARTFNPANPCQNYLADAGSSVATNDAKSFAFVVPANETFVVVVSEVFGNSQCGYQLTVSGGSCQPVEEIPMLEIVSAGPGAVCLSWPSTATGFHLEGTNNLPLDPFAAWPKITNSPVLDGTRYRLTNGAANPQRYFRLRKP